jgi:branched-chain amino acid transport system permease protein
MNLKQSKEKISRFIEKIKLNPVGRILLTAIAIGLFALVPVFIHSSYWIRIFDVAGIYAMMAMGLNIILGYTGLLNLGYAAFFAIGAYMWGILGSPQYNLHWNFWVVFFLAGLLAGIAGFLLAIPGLKLRGDYLALVTIGFGESIRIFANNSKLTMSAVGLIGIYPPSIGPFVIKSAQQYYYLLLAICAIMAFFIKRLEDSRIGNAWKAIREDDLAAESMGLDTRKLKLLANFMGAIPAGMAGVIFAALQSYVSPVSFKFVESITVVSMVVVGGRANVFGAILGALILTILPEPLRGSDFETARILIYGFLLVFMMLFRPEGILHKRSGGKKPPKVEEPNKACE